MGRGRTKAKDEEIAPAIKTNRPTRRSTRSSLAEDSSEENSTSGGIFGGRKNSNELELPSGSKKMSQRPSIRYKSNSSVGEEPKNMDDKIEKIDHPKRRVPLKVSTTNIDDKDTVQGNRDGDSNKYFKLGNSKSESESESSENSSGLVLSKTKKTFRPNTSTPTNNLEESKNVLIPRGDSASKKGSAKDIRNTSSDEGSFDSDSDLEPLNLKILKVSKESSNSILTKNFEKPKNVDKELVRESVYLKGSSNNISDKESIFDSKSDTEPLKLEIPLDSEKTLSSSKKVTTKSSRTVTKGKPTKLVKQMTPAPLTNRHKRNSSKRVSYVDTEDEETSDDEPVMLEVQDTYNKQKNNPKLKTENSIASENKHVKVVDSSIKSLASVGSIMNPKDKFVKVKTDPLSRRTLPPLLPKPSNGLVIKGNIPLGYEKVPISGLVNQGTLPYSYTPFGMTTPNFFPPLGGPRAQNITTNTAAGAHMLEMLKMNSMNPMNMNPMNMNMNPMNMGMNSLNMDTNNPLLFMQNGAVQNYMLNPSTVNMMAQQGWAGALPGKFMSQLWMTNKDKLNPFAIAQVQEEEEDDADDEDLGVAETYADYMPTKLKLGKKHPDPVVETASLSSVEPTEVWFSLSLPDQTIQSGALSALQLEAVTYASQQHEHFLPDGTRAGFLIGDGAGVGKGRTIAGIIFENYLKGRKRSIWVSVSNDLKYDSERDLHDIFAKEIEVYSLNKFKYAMISSAVNGKVTEGVIFSTYSSLISESAQSGGKFKTRMKQLLQWCGDDFDGVIVFDECHRAKNLCPAGSTKPTKTGLTVLELQNKLPKARVVYASATGASEPRNMAYMTRLGIWGEGTPFKEFANFISAVEKRGVGAMEIVAMDMKLRGMYIARQLSFHGVAFKIEEVKLSKEFVELYDNSVKLWVGALKMFTEAADLIGSDNQMKKTMWAQFWGSHQRFFKYLCIAAKVNHAIAVAKEAVEGGKCVVIGLQSTGEARTLEQLEKDDGELTDFVSTAKGVLESLVENHFPAPDRYTIFRLLNVEPSNENGDKEGNNSIGKRKPVRQASQRVPSKRVKTDSYEESEEEDGDSDSSGSEFTLSGSNSNESDSPSEDSVSSELYPLYIDTDSDTSVVHDKRDKLSKRQKMQNKINALATGKGNLATPRPSRELIEKSCDMKDELLKQVHQLGEKLPPNTLDQLIDELGGPEKVAEMTGRKGRVVHTQDGIQYEKRSEVDIPLETLNLTEKQRFMDGEKVVAIISEAASSGISLQSDRRAINQRRRVHITLELPWSADRAIQQFGRTHRSNQVNAPEYIFLISDLAGERRFASTVAKRLESLGALTHGDRRATETRDLSRFNIDNKYGRSALEATMKVIMGYEAPLVPPPKDYKGDFFEDVANALIGVGLINESEGVSTYRVLDKEFNNISKFLNRILGMPVDLQNRLFQYFTDTLKAIIAQAKKSGRFDLGILDLGTAGEDVKRVKRYTYLRKHATGLATTELHIVFVERGLSWKDAIEMLEELTAKEEGFYLSHQVRNDKQTAILAVSMVALNKGSDPKKSKKDQLFAIYRPNTGLQLRQETLGELEKKYKKVTSKEAQKSWEEQYESSSNTCSHAYWSGNCKSVTLGLDCEIGLRSRKYNVLSGSVLSVWTRVESVLLTQTGRESKMQVVRLRTAEGMKIVGTLIPNSCVDALREALASDAEKTVEKIF
uniref:Protein strawberry notch n=1 Tax=Timema shepardi TaxID=629360 RepID=A0A7R9B3U3_TIMSH|nr:unnamed protein product [Timema shepardi]